MWAHSYHIVEPCVGSLISSPGNLHEEYLFHGSGTNSPFALVKAKDGFDPQGRRDAYYSSGSYFAVHARYSHHYAFRSDDAAGDAANPQGVYHHLILAEVLCGVSKAEPQPWPARERVKDGYIRSVLQDQYDSVRGGPHRPRPDAPDCDQSEMYVVYTKTQALPEFVVTYRVRPGVEEYYSPLQQVNNVV